MPDRTSFLPLRRKAPAVATNDLLGRACGAARTLQGDTKGQVAVSADATPAPSLMRGSRAVHIGRTRVELIGACACIAIFLVIALFGRLP